jgi:hypothetical protein
MIWVNEAKHTRIYRILHEPEFGIVAHLKSVTYRFRLNDLVNLNSSVFYEVLLKISKLFQPYDNSGEKTTIFLAEPTIFRWAFDKPGDILSLL